MGIVASGGAKNIGDFLEDQAILEEPDLVKEGGSKHGHYRKDCPERKGKKNDNSKTAYAGVVEDNSDCADVLSVTISSLDGGKKGGLTAVMDVGRELRDLYIDYGEKCGRRRKGHMTVAAETGTADDCVDAAMCDEEEEGAVERRGRCRRMPWGLGKKKTPVCACKSVFLISRDVTFDESLMLSKKEELIDASKDHGAREKVELEIISSMAREKRARASSSRSRAAPEPEPEPEPEPIAVEFDQNRYRNREAADRFSAQLSSPLTPGLRLDTPFLFNIGVLRCLQDCYLDRLTDRNTILYYPDAIRLFYANLTWNISSESCTLTSYVFGRRISFSQSRLATLLDLPDSGFSFSLDMIPVAGQSHWFDRPFSIEEQLRHTLHCRQVRVASKPSLRDLPPLSRLFHHIIAHNVIPRTGGLSLVSYLDVQLLTFFRSGTPLNLPRLIILNMIRSASHPALAIPYGLLLTHILAAFDIPLLGEYIEVTRHIVLDCSTLRRKGLLDDRNRLLPEPELENVIVDDDDDDDEADDDGDDDDADGDDDAADADDDAGGDAGDGFDRDPPPLIIPSTHEAGTSSGPSTSGYEAILTRLDMMQQHMHTGFSRMDLAHSQLSRRLSRMEDHCGIQCPEEDIFHPPPPPSGP
ncbi:hypothetical protein RJ639_031567 [Escallonia herrerae]|uniref:Putative plant transposon protein domain-containing protein n=1 Tax=Escallonia herrerae TaxID=1293975 RepID=A0AA88X041_9ASTE|nr:hypothetical protein RJ639_031567 [Escallonia herrerae]